MPPWRQESAVSKSRSIEYRVRPVTRYIVTSYLTEAMPNGGQVGSSHVVGEFDSEIRAEQVASAMAAWARQCPHTLVIAPDHERQSEG
jgi:hypothetical protein